MDLSAQQFERILGSLRASPDARQGDKRRAPRVRHLGAVSITAPGQTKPTQAQLRNLSVRGLCLAASQPLERGDQFITHVSRPGMPDAALLCTVVHSRKTAAGLYSIGAEFTCLLEGPTAPKPAAQTCDGGDLERIRRSVLA